VLLIKLGFSSSFPKAQLSQGFRIIMCAWSSNFKLQNTVLNLPKIKNCCISAVSFDDRSVSTATVQTITCGITGLSAETAVVWIGPDDNEISVSDTSNYIINQGSYSVGSKSSSLTIQTGKLSTLSTNSVFKCKLKSALYPTHSPDVVKEMTLTLLSLGMFF
jgi:hypothetical protein